MDYFIELVMMEEDIERIKIINFEELDLDMYYYQFIDELEYLKEEEKCKEYETFPTIDEISEAKYWAMQGIYDYENDISFNDEKGKKKYNYWLDDLYDDDYYDVYDNYDF